MCGSFQEPCVSWQRPVAAVALVTAVVPVAAAVAVTGCHHHRRHPCTPSALQRVSSHVVASGALAAVGVSSGGRTQTWANTSCQQYAYRVLYDVKKINFRHTYGAYLGSGGGEQHGEQAAAASTAGTRTDV